MDKNQVKKVERLVRRLNQERSKALCNWVVRSAEFSAGLFSVNLIMAGCLYPREISAISRFVKRNRLIWFVCGRDNQVIVDIQ